MSDRAPAPGAGRAARVSEFGAYKREFVTLTRRALSAQRSPAFSEAAFPAYANPNPAISYLFWQRVRRVMRHLGDARRGRALDFGCGGGVMLPFLAARAREVVAMDVDFSSLTAITAQRSLPANVTLVKAGASALAELPPASFDVILALDVLEHVEDLEGTAAALLRLLGPAGELIVSGPTENILYRAGRMIAGPEYSGDYHVRDVASIRQAFAARAPVANIATLFPVLPLFRIFSVRPAAR